MPYPFHVSYYNQITDRNNPNLNRITVNRFDLYQNIKDGAYSLQTSHVLETHFDDICENFQTISKTDYQATKRATLNGFLPSAIVVDDVVRSITGVVCLDVDNNPKDELTRLKQELPTKDASIEAIAYSVSGKLNGSFFVNVRYHIPPNIHKLPNALKKLIGIRKEDTKSQAYTKYHNAFYRAIAHRYTTRYGLNLRENQNIKQLRYLADDPNIYVNPNAQPYTLQFLQKYLKSEQKQQKEITKFEKRTINIDTSNGFDYAYQFASTKYTFEKGLGQRYLFINQFAICCNLLGIGESDCIDYVNKFLPYEKDLRDCITFPYKNYAESFGKWKHKINPKDISFILKDNQYFSDLTSDIIPLYKSEILKGNTPLFCFKSGTGTGKTYGIVRYLAPKLKAITGKKTIFVCNLNLLTEQTAVKANTLHLTGKPTDKDLEQAFKGEVIVVNHNALKYVAAYMIEQGINAHFFIDESHTLATASYKVGVLSNVLKYVNHLASSIALVSATPKDYFLHLGYKRITIAPNNLVPIQLHKIETTDKPENIVINHIENANFSDGKILMIKVQSKKKIERIKKVLVKMGYTEKEIVTLYSCPFVKNSKAYKRIKETEKDGESFDKKVKIVLCTSFINEGVNIYSQRKIDFINIEDKFTFNYIDLVQFVARHRTDKSKCVYSYHKPSNKELDNKIGDKENIKYFNKLHEIWLRQVDNINTSIEIVETDMQKEIIKTYSSLSNTQKFIQYNEFTQKFEVNSIACMIRAEQVYINSLDTNTAYQKLALEFPHIEVIEDTKQPEIKPEIIEKVEVQKKEDKTQKQADKEVMLELYKTKLFPFLVAFLESSEKQKLKEKVIYHFEEIDPYFSGYESIQDEAFHIIQDNPSLFDENLNVVENFLYYVCKVLDNKLFERKQVLNFLTDEKGKLRSPQKITKMFDQLSIWTFLEADKIEQEHKVNAFTKLQRKELDNLKTVISEINKACNVHGQIGKKKALMIVYKHFKGYTEKQARDFINTVFDCKYSKEKGIYTIKDVSDFSGFFVSIGLEPIFLVGKLRKLLILKGLPQLTLP